MPFRGLFNIALLHTPGLKNEYLNMDEHDILFSWGFIVHMPILLLFIEGWRILFILEDEEFIDKKPI